MFRCLGGVPIIVLLSTCSLHMPSSQCSRRLLPSFHGFCPFQFFSRFPFGRLARHDRFRPSPRRHLQGSSPLNWSRQETGQIRPHLCWIRRPVGDLKKAHTVIFWRISSSVIWPGRWNLSELNLSELNLSEWNLSDSIFRIVSIFLKNRIFIDWLSQPPLHWSISI